MCRSTTHNFTREQRERKTIKPFSNSGFQQPLVSPAAVAVASDGRTTREMINNDENDGKVHVVTVDFKSKTFDSQRQVSVSVCWCEATTYQRRRKELWKLQCCFFQLECLQCRKDRIKIPQLSFRTVNYIQTVEPSSVLISHTFGHRFKIYSSCPADCWFFLSCFFPRFSSISDFSL